MAKILPFPLVLCYIIIVICVVYMSEDNSSLSYMNEY